MFINTRREIPEWLKENCIHLLGITMLVAAVVVWARIASLSAFAADEIAFYIWADDMLRDPASQSNWGFLFRSNGAGYGATYWTLYINLIDQFGPNALWGMRLLAFTAFAFLPIAIAIVGNLTVRYLGYLLAALWLSMPMAWWCGKITGPETFSLAFAVLGILSLYLSSRHELKHRVPFQRQFGIVGWILMGGAISIKMTSLPTALFAFLIFFGRPSLWQQQPKLVIGKRIMEVVGLMFAGFVLLSPICLINPSGFMYNILRMRSEGAWKWSTAKMVLSNNVWNWDGVIAGGLVQWGLCPLALVLLAALLLRRNPRVFAVLCVSFLGAWAMIVSSGSILGWYWFGWIPTMLMAILWSIHGTQPNRKLISGLVAVILINLVVQSPRIVERYQMKSRQQSAVAERSEVERAVRQQLAKRDYDLILDSWEISHLGGLALQDLSKAQLLQQTPERILAFVPPDKVYLPGEPNPRRTGIQPNAFVGLLDLAAKGTEGKSVLLIVSKRLASKHSFAEPSRFIEQEILPKSPPGTTFAQLADMPHTLVYEITSQPSPYNEHTGNVRQASETRKAIPR